MLPDRVSNPGPLTYESGALPRSLILCFGWLLFKGETTLSFSFLPPSKKVGQLLNDRICSFRSKFFPLRVDPFFEGFRCPGKQTESYNSCLCMKQWREKQWRKNGGVTIQLKMSKYLGQIMVSTAG